MAHLLGSKFCLESLRHDIKDVEEIVTEIASRVGVVKAQSWKFPDKLSSDVNIEILLDDCSFIDNEEEDNQVAHVMLYDLLIDRLLYTLHSFTRYNELLLSPEVDSPGKQASRSSSSMSAGLTTKRCWNRMTQLAAVMQQLAQEVERKSARIKSTEELSSHPTREYKSSETAASQSNSAQQISHEVAHRNTQTVETAYSSCEICSRTQACLHEVGKSVVKLCKSQGLPTALEDYISKQSDSSLMSIAEISRWKNLQTKDLSRIDRHLESLVKQIKPLKEQLFETEKQKSSANAEIQRLKTLAEYREKEFSEEQKRRELKLKENVKSQQKLLEEFTIKNSQLMEDSSAFQQQLSEIKDELLRKHRECIQLENERAKLKEESTVNQKFQIDSVKLQSETTELRKTVKQLEERLKLSYAQLEKEVTKNTTLSSHEQAMQEKQTGLLKRLDELDEECEDLRERLCMAEEEKDEMEESASCDVERNKSLQEKLNSKQELATILQKDKETLERRGKDLAAQVDELQAQVEEYIERERLLVAYPDLHKNEVRLPDSSGDVFTDMQRQIEANNLRIALLEKENRLLTKTLSSISRSSHGGSDNSYGSDESGEHYNNENKIQPIQLWRKTKDEDNVSYTSSTISATGFPKKISSKSERGKHSHSESFLSDKSHRSNVIEAYRNIKQQQKEPQTRSSFHIGPGKQRSKTPTTSTPNSGRSALLKPWT